MNNDRILPCDLDAEQSLLEACCCPTGIERVVDLIEPSDFYSEGGKLIFSKMMELHQSGCGFTLYQIDRAFQEHSDYIGIRQILDTLIPATAECAIHFAKIVKGLSDRRKAIKTAYSIYEQLHDPSTPLEPFAGLITGLESSGLVTAGGPND